MKLSQKTDIFEILLSIPFAFAEIAMNCIDEFSSSNTSIFCGLIDFSAELDEATKNFDKLITINAVT